MKLKYNYQSLVLPLSREAASQELASRSFACRIAGRRGGETFCTEENDPWTVNGKEASLSFPSLGLKLIRRLEAFENGCRESIEIQNNGTQMIHLDAVDLGYLFPLEGQTLHALPFPVQQDGMRHIYSAQTLRSGHFQAFVNNQIPSPSDPIYGNSVYSDPSRKEPPLYEDGRLRSEGWFWGSEDGGLLIAKYNNREIEYSIAEPVGPERAFLRLGGTGFCLYGEPSPAHTLAPGTSFLFGDTCYLPCRSFLDACYSYRRLLNSRGHDLPEDYEPNIHWNELYDIGWFHSDRNELNRHYTLDRLLLEAKKAKACGCDALYLDPGWEFAEGTSLFDYHRLGDEKDLVRLLRRDYGLELSIRCILRTYIPYWPDQVNAVHTENGIATACMLPHTIIPSNQLLYEQCLCHPAFAEEKARRIEKLVEDGATFLMFDEMDWRGPCYCQEHGHPTPSTAFDHADAVMRLAGRIKDKYQIPIEVHDPVWPWNSAVYTPVYWRQGFGSNGSYTENWGFEFMWECIDDLQSGRALSLYYYNLCCSIPLYLHINMSADNDQCLFFWWAASTIRHLGIGGKDCHPSVVPPGKHFDFDPEQRFAAYQECMAQYRPLKAYYQRGIFYGIHEYAHLHVLKGKKGGVLDLFNCTDSPMLCTAGIPVDLLNGRNLEVQGATVFWDKDVLHAELSLPALSHGLVLIGEAVR